MKAHPPFTVLTAHSRVGFGLRSAFLQSDKELGFTLIELIIVMTILGILTSVALPSFSGFIAEQRIKNASFDVVTTLMLARSEALKRNANVTISPVGGIWADGWSVAVTVSGATTTVSRQAAYKNLTISGPASVIYNSGGRLASSAAAFEISNSANSGKRCIRIDLSGRPNSKKEAC